MTDNNGILRDNENILKDKDILRDDIIKIHNYIDTDIIYDDQN